MDFYCLPRRDLQFFCKKNKIPANMTNIAMADALKALEIVEGIDEYMNQSEFNRDQSPTSIAKNLPSAARTAARTTRRKSTKEETQSSELVTRSCLVASKSLSEEMEQENRNMNMLQDPSVPQSRRRAAATSVSVKLDVSDINPEANVSKTPATRSTRRTQAAASCKKDESVQRVYSTRRSVRLLEESMADLSLKTKESLIVPEKKNEDAQREDSPAGSKFEAISDENLEKNKEAEVMSVRDLNDSMEKEWDGSKNDPNLGILYGDLGDITFSDVNTSKEHMKGIETNTVTVSNSFVLVKEQETSQEDDFVIVDHATVIVACNKESESEHMQIGSESESEETEYETDSNEEAFESKVSSARDNVSKVDSKVLDSWTVKSEVGKPKEEEICESGKLIDSEAEAAALVSLTGKEVEVDSDWSTDFDIDDIKLEDNICGYTKSEEAPVSDNKKTPASSSSTLVGKETKTQLSQFEAESISESYKEKKVEMVVINNEEGKTEAEAKKKTKKKIDEESLKDVSKRQLLKMLKELTITSKEQHKCAE